METRDFFAQINFPRGVKAPTRNVDQVGVFVAGDQNKTEAGHDAADFAVADFFTENPPHFAALEFDRSLIELASDDVDHAAHQFSAARFENQFGYAVGR